MHLDKHQLHWLHTLIECSELLCTHGIPLIHPTLYILIIFIVIAIVPTLSHLLFLNVNVTCKLYQRCGCLVKYFIDSGLGLWYIKLLDNTLCDQVKNVCKTAGLTFWSLECVDELFKLAYHLVIIACVIASDTQYLISCKWQQNQPYLLTDLMRNTKVFEDLGKHRCKSEPCV